MRIDASHSRWALASLTLFLLATAGYLAYAISYPGGPRGNSVPGLIYGISGYAMMLYAGLMGARRKVPLWRIGRAQAWMRGHLWMGWLSLPFLIYHSAFNARGPLTLILMVLLLVVVLSGVGGAVIQHFAPKRLSATVPLETIYEQIPEVREQLRGEASGIIERLCTAPNQVDEESGEETLPLELTEAQQLNLRHVYAYDILPFLRDPESGSSPLTSPTKAKVFFDALRRQMPAAVHEAVSDLESICEEERQLSHQRRMYILIHAWTLVHVPLSILLLVLGGIHALVAIRY